VAAGGLALLLPWLPYACLPLGALGLGLAVATWMRRQVTDPLAARLGNVGGGLSVVALGVCVVILVTRLLAETPGAIASHGWWASRRQPADIEQLVATLESMRPEEALFVDGSGRSVKTRVPAMALAQTVQNSSYRPPGLERPFLCIYIPPSTLFRPMTRLEALHALRSKLDTTPRGR
jgi:hypothetical protein